MRTSIEALDREKAKAMGELEAIKRSENSLKLELSEAKKAILEHERKSADEVKVLRHLLSESEKEKSKSLGELEALKRLKTKKNLEK